MSTALEYIQDRARRLATATGAVAVANLYSGRADAAARFQNNITFPSDLLNSDRNYYISLRFEKFVKRGINSPPQSISDGSIKLPIPNNLKDNTSVNYQNEKLGPAAGAILDLAAREIGEVSNLPDAISNLSARLSPAAVAASVANPITAVYGVATNAPQATSDVALGAAAQTLLNSRIPGIGAVRSGVSQFTGLSINPFMTVMFENPEFKTHNFSWRLVPRSSEESQKIKEIIDSIRYHMLPGISSGAGVLFSYPEIVKVSLHPKDDYTYKFKTCVIKDFTANYAPAGMPSFYRGTDAPTAVEISMTLQEIEYWTKNDFPQGGGS